MEEKEQPLTAPLSPRKMVKHSQVAEYLSISFEYPIASPLFRSDSIWRSDNIYNLILKVMLHSISEQAMM
jgi:hypothetical protein